MKPPVQVLHLLSPHEDAPPQNLQAAAVVKVMHAGNPPDASLFTEKPQVITLCTPIDRDVTVALTQLEGLNLPVLGLGDTSVNDLDANASEHISPEDLKSMLSLLSLVAHNDQSSKRESSRSTEDDHMYRVTEHVITLIEHLMNLRFPSYQERAERVFQSCVWIGSHLALPNFELRELLYAARLREIGKLGIPDYIVLTPREKRTSEQQSVYDRYPSLGATVLTGFPSLRGAARIIEHQLDNFDGSSPSGLMAHQIPLGSRILRVTGAFEMILEESATIKTEAEAIELLERGRGSLYDPLLVKLFCNYRNLTAKTEHRIETKRVTFGDLVEGMVLAEDIWSRNGMKIVARGTRINSHILKILFSLPPDPNQEMVEIMRK